MSVLYADLPKVELHVHLDCSLSFELVSKIDPAISLEDYQKNFVGPSKCTNLKEYLSYAIHALELLQTKDHLRWALRDLVEQLQKDKVIYAEVRFAPFLHTRGGLTAREVVSCLDAEIESLQKEYNIHLGLILCTLREFDSQKSMETVELVQEFRHSQVVGFDIAGDEAGYELEAHAAAFAFAARKKLFTTAHCGEARGAESVSETLAVLGPHRLGHGTRSWEDTRLLETIKSLDKHLEICPSSNVQTNVVGQLNEHPVASFLKQNISLSINTDARTITDTSLNEEFGKLEAIFGFNIHDWYHTSCEAVRHAFTSIEVKKILLAQLQSAYEKAIETQPE